jgi:hypothetical protein
MMPKWLVPTAFITGIALLLTLLTLVVIIRDPTRQQQDVFHVVQALAGAAFASGFAGQLVVQLEWRGAAGVSGVGGAAVFCILYFFPPRSLANENNVSIHNGDNNTVIQQSPSAHSTPR